MFVFIIVLEANDRSDGKNLYMYDIEELWGVFILCVGECEIGLWNVVGSVEIKVIALIKIVEGCGIGILCLE